MKEFNKIGGNSFLIILGKFTGNIAEYLKNKAEKWIYEGNPRVISNPSATFISPFIILLNFTIDGVSKYHLILEGQFSERYKNDKELVQFTENEMFMSIRNNRNKWFKKELET